MEKKEFFVKYLSEMFSVKDKRRRDTLNEHNRAVRSGNQADKWMTTTCLMNTSINEVRKEVSSQRPLLQRINWLSSMIFNE